MKRDVLRIGSFIFLIFCFTFIFNAKITLSQQNMGVFISCIAGAENSTIHSKTEYSDSTIDASAASRNVYEASTNGNGSFSMNQTFSAVQNTGYIEALNYVHKEPGVVDHIRTKNLIGTEGTQAIGDDFVSLEQYGVGSGSFMRNGDYFATMSGSSLKYVTQTVTLDVVGYSQVGASAHYYNYSAPTIGGNNGVYSPGGWDEGTVFQNDSESLKYRLGMYGEHNYSGTIGVSSPNYIAPPQ